MYVIHNALCSRQSMSNRYKLKFICVYQSWVFHCSILQFDIISLVLIPLGSLCKSIFKYLYLIVLIFEMRFKLSVLFWVFTLNCSIYIDFDKNNFVINKTEFSNQSWVSNYLYLIITYFYECIKNACKIFNKPKLKKLTPSKLNSIKYIENML